MQLPRTNTENLRSDIQRLSQIIQQQHIQTCQFLEEQYTQTCQLLEQQQIGIHRSIVQLIQRYDTNFNSNLLFSSGQQPSSINSPSLANPNPSVQSFQAPPPVSARPSMQIPSLTPSTRTSVVEILRPEPFYHSSIRPRGHEPLKANIPDQTKVPKTKKKRKRPEKNVKDEDTKEAVEANLNSDSTRLKLHFEVPKIHGLR